MKLLLLPKQLENKVNKFMFNQFIKYRSLCQKHGKSSSCSKFILQDHVNFNYSTFADIMYIYNSSILHTVDKTSKYQSATWLQNITQNSQILK